MQEKTLPAEQTYFVHRRREMLPFVPRAARRVLDVGCGSGAFTAEMAREIKAEYWGVELDAQAVARAEPVFHRLLQGDVFAKLPELPEKSFDVIVCNDVLEHVAQPFELLEKLRGKLSPTGVVVASIPNVRYIKNLYHVVVQKDWEYRDEGILDRTHLRFFTKRSLERSLTANGWRIQRLEGINPTRMRAAFRVLNLLSLGHLADTEFTNFAVVFSPA